MNHEFVRNCKSKFQVVMIDGAEEDMEEVEEVTEEIEEEMTIIMEEVVV